MAPVKSMIIYGGVAAIVVIGALVGVYFLWQNDGQGQEALEPMPTPPPLRPRPTPTTNEELIRSRRIAGVTLADSDALVQELVAELSTHPKLIEWFANDDMIRRMVASIDNVANGTSPTAHLGFLKPEERFKVIEVRGDFVIDPVSFERYNLVTGIFASLDTGETIRRYRELEPLLEEAYREIGPPNRRFRDTVFLAIRHLLRVPIIEDEIFLSEKVVTYEMIDESLESLSAAQRHLLRMGPHNVRIIQGKLRELEKELTRPPGAVSRADADQLDGELTGSQPTNRQAPSISVRPAQASDTEAVEAEAAPTPAAGAGESPNGA